MRDLMTVREAARECKRATETVRRWIWDGKLPAQKRGNRLFIKKRDLVRMRHGRRGREASDELAVLHGIKFMRERIRPRIGGSTIDVLEALERTRGGHPSV
jgi:excisionase family DNA binding protein